MAAIMTTRDVGLMPAKKKKKNNTKAMAMAMMMCDDIGALGEIGGAADVH